MAGFIFSISKKEGINGVKKCIKNGYYASIVPNKGLDNPTGARVVASVLADFCSMKEGDNVYFLSNRQIYGAGKMKKIGPDCKYKNYLSAHELVEKNNFEEDDAPLTDLTPEYRWVCFFEPEGQFFEKGIDMDEVLLYKPESFRMLRAFQDVTFIKIDNEENRALKECLYLKNRGQTEIFEFSDSEHKRIGKIDLKKYLIVPEETIGSMYDKKTGEIRLEMLLEAAILNKIMRGDFLDTQYDYVTHQVIASPFKPLAYIDKMDIFAYKYLDNYPDSFKPIEKYLVIEIKKGRANSELLLQLMRYVDWISKEYAAGDYSLIKAIGISHEYSHDVSKTLKQYCTRSYLSDTHPNVSSEWNDLTLYAYTFDGKKLELSQSTIFDGIAELEDQLNKFEIEFKKSNISRNGKVYKPLFKISKPKIAFFKKISEDDKNILEEADWKIIEVGNLENECDVNKIVSKLFKEGSLQKG